MLIRPVSAADIAEIKTTWNAVIRDTTATFTSQEKTTNDLLDLIEARRDQFLVAGDQGTCLGFVTWGAFRAGDGYAHTAEHTIITVEKGRGVGRALLLHALMQAHAQGIHVMVAGIGHENAAAVAFHERLGFAKAGRLPQVGRKNGRWHDLILMSRTTETP